MRATRSNVGYCFHCIVVLILFLFPGCNPLPTPDDQTSINQPSVQATPEKTPVAVPQVAVQQVDVPQVLPQFDDVSSEMGISAPFYSDVIPNRFFLPEIMGGGVTWFDFDIDGVLDLFLVNGSHLDQHDQRPTPRGDWLYRGRPNKQFQAVPDKWGAADLGYGQGSAAGDFNSDGFPDLYIGNYGTNSLYLNEGDGTFTPVHETATTSGFSWTSSVVWVDLNFDKLLDLYVTNYLDVSLADRKICDYDGRPGYCGPGQYESAPDRAYLNKGDGSFVESADMLGLVDTFGKGLAVVVADLNQDFLPEMYVGNDMTPNFLFTPEKNKDTGGVTYRDVAGIGGAAQSGEGMNEASMGISCADFDGDDRLDLFLTHYYNSQDTLYRNHGDLQFEDVSKRMGTAQVGYAYLGFGTVPIDYDADGLDDLFITNGHVLGPLVQPDRMPPQLLHNRNGKRFDDAQPELSDYFQKKWLGRGAASADFDSDGDLDLVVTHLDDPAALLKNSTVTGKGYVGFKLTTTERIHPVGARLTIITSAGSKTRSVTAGGSYLSSSDGRLLFHTDPDQMTTDIKVEWPSGKSEEYRGLETGRYWHLCEGNLPW